MLDASSSTFHCNPCWYLEFGCGVTSLHLRHVLLDHTCSTPQSSKSRPSLPHVSTRSFDQLLFSPGLSRAAELRHETICLPQQKRGVSTKCGHSRTQKRWQRLKIAGVSGRKVHTPPAQLVDAGPRCLNALLNRLLSSAKYGSERGAVLHPVSGRQRNAMDKTIT